MSAIGSAPTTPDLAELLYRSLRDIVVKTEVELADQDEMRQKNYLPERRCTCHSLHSGPGCKPCLVKRGRTAMAEYEATRGPRCSDCGNAAGDGAAMRWADETTELVCGRCFAIHQALGVLDGEVAG